jgi:hypothetical protein
MAPTGGPDFNGSTQRRVEAGASVRGMTSDIGLLAPVVGLGVVFLGSQAANKPSMSATTVTTTMRVCRDAIVSS